MSSCSSSLSILELPQGSVTVEVNVINTTATIIGQAAAFVQPTLPGQAVLKMPVFSFIIRHSRTNEVILFDLGVRKDWWNLSPSTVTQIETSIPGLSVEKDIVEILEEGGFDPKDVKTVIWSHWHWDHIGDISRLDKSVSIVVGPGFKDEFPSGFPTQQSSPILDSDICGDIREMKFDGDLYVGGFEAIDFFDDGSLFLLNTPGHAKGHISALARTTPTTFALLGGDVCHFASVLRPTPQLPMPDCPSARAGSSRISSSHRKIPDLEAMQSGRHIPVPRTRPLQWISDTKDSWYSYPEMAQETVDTLRAFDAHPDVLVCPAHDVGLLDAVEFFPWGHLNEWQAQGWKEKAMWGFLKELPIH